MKAEKRPMPDDDEDDDDEPLISRSITLVSRFKVIAKASLHRHEVMATRQCS